MRDDQRAALALDEIGDAKVLLLERLLRVHQQDHDFGETDGIERIGNRELFELLLDPGTAPQPGGVVNAEGSILPSQIDRDGVAGDAGLGPRQQPLLAEQPIDQRRFSGNWAGRPRRCGSVCARRLRSMSARRRRVAPPLPRRGGIGQRRAQPCIEIGEALAVLGGDRDRLAEAELVGFAARRPRRRYPRSCWRPGSRACPICARDRRRRGRPASTPRARRSGTAPHRRPRSRPRSAPACGRSGFRARPLRGPRCRWR